jgi:hypothetical protein
LSRHQSNSLQTRALCNVDHLGDRLEIQVFVRAHKDDMIGSVFENSSQTGVQIFQSEGLLIEAHRSVSEYRDYNVVPRRRRPFI